MDSIDWKTASVEYKLETHSHGRFVLLVFGCLFSAAPALVIVILLGFLDLLRESAAFIPVGTVFVLLTPFMVYFAFRKWLRTPVTIRLEPGKIIIQRATESTTLPIDKIKSYEAGSELEGDDSDSVFIRDVEGKTIKITASLLSGSLRHVASFRHDFILWAKVHNLTQWSPWHRR